MWVWLGVALAVVLLLLCFCSSSLLFFFFFSSSSSSSLLRLFFFFSFLFSFFFIFFFFLLVFFSFSPCSCSCSCCCSCSCSSCCCCWWWWWWRASGGSGGPFLVGRRLSSSWSPSCRGQEATNRWTTGVIWGILFLLQKESGFGCSTLCIVFVFQNFRPAVPVGFQSLCLRWCVIVCRVQTRKGTEQNPAIFERLLCKTALFYPKCSKLMYMSSVSFL